ncbi:hypothetical protein [Pseudomonas sp.]|uniref:hypothetical protein n=1 Tax=Pseudomonas sp. TaxID=306 RepID=UPI002906342E|nr:hypothetical protein [Pseudomonas sp.]MDU4254411.1 hypothetical protein [Pseudomonas sp.]
MPRSRKPRRCAVSPLNSEFSLCGDAFDAHYDYPEAHFEFVQPGESITCAKCCMVIRTVRAITNLLRPRADDE